MLSQGHDRPINLTKLIPNELNKYLLYLIGEGFSGRSTAWMNTRTGGIAIIIKFLFEMFYLFLPLHNSFRVCF